MFSLGLIPTRSNVHGMLPRVVIPLGDSFCPISTTLRRLAVLVGTYVCSKFKLSCKMHKSQTHFWVAIDAPRDDVAAPFIARNESKKEVCRCNSRGSVIVIYCILSHMTDSGFILADMFGSSPWKLLFLKDTKQLR